MRCINLLRAGFDLDGNITYRSRSRDRSIESFGFECRKCLPCRLNIAREKAIRCIHEARCHSGNIFFTATYDDAHLESPRLIYSHFQSFMKDLRDRIGYDDDKRISFMVTGEYGELNKRPHWHALIFNYFPIDAKEKYKTELGDQVWSSAFLTDIWKRGSCEFGSVTLDSAGYVARYAAKKLVHGRDQDHDFHPIHKTSSRRAIGRSWIEKYWKHTFDNGFVTLPNGSCAKIPRYYVDWLKKYKPDEWLRYVTQVRPDIMDKASVQARREELEFISSLMNRNYFLDYPLTRSKVKATILQTKFKQLQEKLKL